MSSKINIISHIILYPFIVLLIILIVNGSSNFNSASSEIAKKAAYKAIEKSFMQCYASEGSYPNDLEYLEKNYGLILDRENFSYEYTVFSSNVMPEILIFENIRKDIDYEQ